MKVKYIHILFVNWLARMSVSMCVCVSTLALISKQRDKTHVYYAHVLET